MIQKLHPGIRKRPLVLVVVILCATIGTYVAVGYWTESLDQAIARIDNMDDFKKQWKAAGRTVRRFGTDRVNERFSEERPASTAEQLIVIRGFLEGEDSLRDHLISITQAVPDRNATHPLVIVFAENALSVAERRQDE